MSIAICDAQILAVLYEDLQYPCVLVVLSYVIGNAVRMFSL